MGLTLSSGPAVEPLSTADAKTHLRVDSSTENDYIDALVKAARIDTERRQDRQLITATYVLKMDRFPSCDYIDLPRPPLQSVTSVVYLDIDGASQTLSTSYYTTDISQEPGRIYVDRSTWWPATDNVRNAVTITYKAGYGDAASDVPAPTIHSIRMKVAHWFENREPAVVGVSIAEVPMAAQHLDNCQRFLGNINVYDEGIATI